MIHILLPVHNRADVTAGFLTALQQQDFTGYRLVVVNDGCQDDTINHVRMAIPEERLKVLQGDGNLWWAGALQLGYEALCAEPIADDDAVLIVNDDVTFEPDFLRQGLQVLSEYPLAAIQALGIDRVTGSADRGAVADLIKLRFVAATHDQPANCLSTRGLLMKASIFKHSGGFRPRWLPHYLSDYEYTLRLHHRGVPLTCDDRFKATVRLELTGNEHYCRKGLATFWSQAFSNRAKYNPKHWSAFILMVCPFWVIPFHLTRIWVRFSLAALRAVLP